MLWHLFLPTSPVSKLDRRHTRRLRKRDGREGVEWGEEPIRMSLALYKSFKTLCFFINIQIKDDLELSSCRHSYSIYLLSEGNHFHNVLICWLPNSFLKKIFFFLHFAETYTIKAKTVAVRLDGGGGGLRGGWWGHMWIRLLSGVPLYC